ncbi:hypothetical protein [Allobaculum sp. Allo2]|uniref:hypothetical protein n=1 Tax=Allobaculum sp. Allo2 TaxID=2853432 RepID=UPI001F609E53|nr:hypothetical protein [Allobaculum sp. Allo2]UNT92894.1 hypothetical protein KWG61_12635 [Allobaculum sp. Allo2]
MMCEEEIPRVRIRIACAIDLNVIAGAGMLAMRLSFSFLRKDFKASIRQLDQFFSSSS